MNAPRPTAEKTLDARLPHRLGDDEPRRVRHVPSDVVTTFAGGHDVATKMTELVVDAVDGLPELIVPAVAAGFHDQASDELEVEIVCPHRLAVRLAGVLEDCPTDIISSPMLVAKPYERFVPLVVFS
jgi:hypothetical protein